MMIIRSDDPHCICKWKSLFITLCLVSEICQCQCFDLKKCIFQKERDKERMRDGKRIIIWIKNGYSKIRIWCNSSAMLQKCPIPFTPLYTRKIGRQMYMRELGSSGIWTTQNSQNRRLVFFSNLFECSLCRLLVSGEPFSLNTPHLETWWNIFGYYNWDNELDASLIRNGGNISQWSKQSDTSYH